MKTKFGFYFFSVILTFAFTVGVYGQGTSVNKPPLPEGPLLKRAPDHSTWTITCRNSGASSNAVETAAANASTGSAGVFFTELRATKTGTIVHEQITFPSGRKSEFWHDREFKAFYSGNNKQPVISPAAASADIYHVDYRKADFAGLDWVSPETYIGVQSVKGRDCLVFAKKISLLSAENVKFLKRKREMAASMEAAGNDASDLGDLEDKPEEAKVWIDLETRLPVVATFGKEARFYQFGSPPTAKIVLPADLAALQKVLLARHQRNAKN